jgi:hypothetical protein
MNEYVLYIIVALGFSVLVNVFLFWYARMASGRLTVVASNIDEIMSALERFGNHLETLYEMETFYGDETLHGVLVHTKSITDFLLGFEDIYELSDHLTNEKEEEEWEETDDSKKGSDTTTTAKKEEEKKTHKKTVFYSGT